MHVHMCAPMHMLANTGMHTHTYAYTHMHTELLCSPSAPGGQHKGLIKLIKSCFLKL